MNKEDHLQPGRLVRIKPHTVYSPHWGHIDAPCIGQTVRLVAIDGPHVRVHLEGHSQSSVFYHCLAENVEPT